MREDSDFIFIVFYQHGRSYMLGRMLDGPEEKRDV